MSASPIPHGATTPRPMREGGHSSLASSSTAYRTSPRAASRSAISIDWSWTGRRKAATRCAPSTRGPSPADARALHISWCGRGPPAHAPGRTGDADRELPMSATELVYRTYIECPQHRVWSALYEPEHTSAYWGVRLTSDWAVGSAITWFYAGVTLVDPDSVVVAFDAPDRLSY